MTDSFNTRADVIVALFVRSEMGKNMPKVGIPVFKDVYWVSQNASIWSVANGYNTWSEALYNDDVAMAAYNKLLEKLVESVVPS